MTSIVLIIPWFGRFRADNDFWLKSIEYNHTVDFLMFSDQECPLNLPKNMTFVKITYEEFVGKIQSKFDFDVSAHYSYKLCDFRPAYGYVLNDYIGKYDFWGHCDNDLVFGDIRHFITEEILSENDRVLVRGHFTLYRNNEDVNRSFMNAEPSYKEVFTHKKNYYFDETPATGKYWREVRRDRLYDEIIFDDLHPYRWLFVDVHRNDYDKNRKYLFYIFDNGKLYRCYFENGNLCRNEAMYAHFQKKQLQIETTVDDKFIIVPNKIITYKEDVTLDFIRSNVRDIPFYKYYKHLKVRLGGIKRELLLLLHNK